MAAFGHLLDVMDVLREKCPWDKKQTNGTLRPLTIEETYELADAIIKGDDDELSKELGDLLLHIVFYAKLGEELGTYNIATVCEGIVKKLIHRHPHIYSTTKVENEGEVKSNWEKLKLQEGKKSVLEGVPDALPSMVKAIRLQEKAKGVGFEWPEAKGAIAKLREELDELEEAIAQNNQQDIEAEFGDFLFSAINVSRFFSINADNALERTNQKFKSRFEYMELKAEQQGMLLQNMTLNEMDVLWDQAKNHDAMSY